MTGGILPYVTPSSVKANKDRKKEVLKFNVLIYDFNSKKVKSYDIMPYLRRCYKEWADKPSTFEEFKKFILEECRCQFWSRCEYELVVNSFPESKEIKIDIYQQIMMNIDLITKILMEEVKK